MAVRTSAIVRAVVAEGGFGGRRGAISRVVTASERGGVSTDESEAAVAGAVKRGAGDGEGVDAAEDGRVAGGGSLSGVGSAIGKTW